MNREVSITLDRKEITGNNCIEDDSRYSLKWSVHRVHSTPIITGKDVMQEIERMIRTKPDLVNQGATIEITSVRCKPKIYYVAPGG